MPPVLVDREPFPPSATRGRGGAEEGEDARGCRAAGGEGDAEEDDEDEEDMLTSAALVEGGGGGEEGVEERTRSSFL